MTTCLSNLKRLIKPSNFQKKEFHPIVMKVGSARRGEMGLIDIATELEIIARGLGLKLHDKIINVLDSQWGMFNVSRCIDNRYAVKIHETNLVGQVLRSKFFPSLLFTRKQTLCYSFHSGCHSHRNHRQTTVEGNR